MNGIAEYLLSVSAAAIIGSVVLRLLSGKGSTATVGRMLCSLFVALTVITPITKVRISDLTGLLPDASADANAVVAQGQSDAKKAMAESITARVEAYILDKATQLGVKLTVQVELSDDTIPVPVRLRLKGNISPYTKGKLQKMIQDDLGIDKENQIWT